MRATNRVETTIQRRQPEQEKPHQYVTFKISKRAILSENVPIEMSGKITARPQL